MKNDNRRQMQVQQIGAYFEVRYRDQLIALVPIEVGPAVQIYSLALLGAATEMETANGERG